MLSFRRRAVVLFVVHKAVALQLRNTETSDVEALPPFRADSSLAVHNKLIQFVGQRK